MAVSVKAGSFAKANNSAATAGVPITQAVTGVGFTPKALILWSSGATATGVAGASIANQMSFISGTAASATGAVAGAATNGVNPSAAGRRLDQLAFLLCSNVGGATSKASLSSFDSDGFTLSFTKDVSTLYEINYLAIGGTDLTNAQVVNWTMPTSNTNKAVTGVGFKPDLVLHISGGALATSLNNPFTQLNTMFGAMDKNGNQFFNAASADDNANPPNTEVYQDTTAALAEANSGFGGVNIASFVSMDSDGFTVNFTVDGLSAGEMFSLCLKGPSMTVGNFTKSTTTSGFPFTQAITGLPTAPLGVFFASNMQTTNAGATNTGYRTGYGASSGTAGVFAGNTAKKVAGAGNPSVTQNLWESAHLVDKPNDTTTLLSKFDLSSLDSGGFTLNYPASPNDAVATQVNYISFGNPTIGVSDATTTSESVKLLSTAFISVSDSTSTSESISMNVTNPGTMTVSVNDTANTSESINLAANPLLIKVSDSTATSESIGTVRPAPLLTIANVGLIAQETGVINKYTPTSPTFTRVNQTETFDMLGGDLGLLWDDGTGGVLLAYGDSYGTDMIGPFGAVLTSGNSTTIGAASDGVAITSLTGSQTVTVASTTGFAAAGQVSTVTSDSSGPGGWAAFYYTSKNSTHFFNCTWLVGGGNLTLSNQVVDADPRTGGEKRGNLVARSTDTNLSDGYTITDFRPSSSSVAQQPITFTFSGSVPANAFPADSPVFNISTINVASSFMTIVTTTAHGISRPAGHPNPVGPSVYISGTTSTSTTVAVGSNGVDVSTSFTGSQSLNVTTVSGMNNSGSVAVLTSAGVGSEAIIAYTSKTAGQLLNCTLTSGSGTLSTGNAVVQGVDGVNNTDWVIWDIPNATTIRVNRFSASNRVGRSNIGTINTAFNDFVATPNSAPQASMVPTGGISVANGGGAGITRQYLYCIGITYWGAADYSNAMFLFYSDDVGQTWTKSSVNWPNNSTFTSLITQASPIQGTDGNIYLLLSGISDPPSIARVPTASVLTKSAYQYWNGSSWITNDPTVLAPLWTDMNQGVPIIGYTMLLARPIFQST
jgi:hypothetical protein